MLAPPILPFKFADFVLTSSSLHHELHNETFLYQRFAYLTKFISATKLHFCWGFLKRLAKTHQKDSPLVILDTKFSASPF